MDVIIKIEKWTQSKILIKSNMCTSRPEYTERPDVHRKKHGITTSMIVSPNIVIPRKFIPPQTRTKFIPLVFELRSDRVCWVIHALCVAKDPSVSFASLS